MLDDPDKVNAEVLHEEAWAVGEPDVLQTQQADVRSPLCRKWSVLVIQKQ